MPFDPISWALGYGLSSAVNVGRSAIAPNQLRQRLIKVAKNWARDQTDRDLFVDPEALFPYSNDGGADTEGSARAKLKSSFQHGKVPSIAEWSDAIWERWQEVRKTLVDAAQPFFICDKSVAEEAIAELAAGLHKECVQDSAMFKSTVLSLLESLKFLSQRRLNYGIDPRLLKPSLQILVALGKFRRGRKLNVSEEEFKPIDELDRKIVTPRDLLRISGSVAYECFLYHCSWTIDGECNPHSDVDSACPTTRLVSPPSGEDGFRLKDPGADIGLVTVLQIAHSAPIANFNSLCKSWSISPTRTASPEFGDDPIYRKEFQLSLESSKTVSSERGGIDPTPVQVFHLPPKLKTIYREIERTLLEHGVVSALAVTFPIAVS